MCVKNKGRPQVADTSDRIVQSRVTECTLQDTYNISSRYHITLIQLYTLYY